MQIPCQTLNDVRVLSGEVLVDEHKAHRSLCYPKPVRSHHEIVAVQLAARVAYSLIRLSEGPSRRRPVAPVLTSGGG
jgi:hypothetical protein